MGPRAAEGELRSGAEPLTRTGLRATAFFASGLLACGLTATGATTGSEDAGSPATTSSTTSSGSTTSTSASSSSGVVPEAGAPIILEPDAGGCIRPGRARSYEEEVIADQPSSWLRLDDTAGPSVKDLSSTAPGATFSTKGIKLGEPGATCGGRAIGLDGKEGKLTYNLARTFAEGQTFSIEVWAQRGGGTNDEYVRRVFAYGAADGSKPLFTLQTNGDYTILFQRIAVSGVNDTYAKGPVITEGPWHHYVAVVGDTHMRLYVDGAVVASSPKKTLGTPSGPLVFGDYTEPAFAKWKGLLDEIAIYDRELPAARIAAHFDAGKP